MNSSIQLYGLSADSGSRIYPSKPNISRVRTRCAQVGYPARKAVASLESELS